MPSIFPSDRAWSNVATSTVDGSASRWWSAQRVGHIRDLLRELIARDLKLRYRGSVLGVAWTLLNPIAELLVLLFIFSAVLRLSIPNYAAFIFTGLLVVLIFWMYHIIAHRPGGQPIGALEAVFAKIGKSVRRVIPKSRFDRVEAAS